MVGIGCSVALDSNPGLPQFSCLVRLVSTPPILKKCCAGCDPPANIEGRCPSTTRHSVHFSPPHVRQSKTGLHSVALSRLPSPLWAVDQVHAKCNPLSAWWRNLWPSATFQLAGHLRKGHIFAVKRHGRHGNSKSSAMKVRWSKVTLPVTLQTARIAMKFNVEYYNDLPCLSSNPVWVFKVCSMQWPLVLLSSQLQQCDLSWSF